jgi:hypothetical protein
MTKLDFLRMCGKDNIKWGSFQYSLMALEKFRRYAFYLFCCI